MAPLPYAVGPGANRVEERAEVHVIRRVTVRHYPAPLFAQFLEALHHSKMTGTVTVKFNISQGSMTSFDAEDPDR